MADHNDLRLGLRLGLRVDQLRHLSDVVQHGVRHHVEGRVGAAEVAHVWRPRPLANASQRGPGQPTGVARSTRILKNHGTTPPAGPVP